MARTVTWSPAAPELFRLPETAGAIEYAITATVQDTDPTSGLPVPVAVSGYQGEITPAQSLMVVTSGTDALTVTAHSLAGLFPFDSLEYLQDGKLEQVATWAALPADAEEIIAYKPSRDTERAFTLAVTATLEDGSEESTSYALVIQQDWSAGRDRLRNEVNARRD